MLQDKAPWLSYVAVVSVIGVVVGFAIGPGAIPWLMVGEIFPSKAISSATSLCVGANWLFNFVVGISFESIQVRDYSAHFVGLRGRGGPVLPS